MLKWVGNGVVSILCVVELGVGTRLFLQVYNILRERVTLRATITADQYAVFYRAMQVRCSCPRRGFVCCAPTHVRERCVCSIVWTVFCAQVTFTVQVSALAFAFFMVAGHVKRIGERNYPPFLEARADSSTRIVKNT